MASSNNTVILLKYSNANGTPTSLNTAEPAYSNVSNKLWIGDGTDVVAIGGKYYTDQVDGATSSNTANKIVKRDSSGNISANVITANTIVANITGTITGQAASAVIANTANALTTARNITDRKSVV